MPKQSKPVSKYEHTRLRWTDQCQIHKIEFKDTAEIGCRLGIKMAELYSLVEDDSQLCRAISCFYHKAFLIFLTGSKLLNATHCMNAINQTEKRKKDMTTQKKQGTSYVHRVCQLAHSSLLEDEVAQNRSSD